jgi:hypothetical protein
MIRALSDASWAFLVLAEPVVEQEISKLRNNVINETRDILTAYPTTSVGIANPLAQHYMELLKQALQALTQSQTLGAWRTAVYLLSENTSYYRLASLWRGVFSGDKSVLDPVRVWDSTDVAALATSWAMPEVQGAPGYGHYRHPFSYQTLLTSAQLAAYIHLPQLETAGFSVTTIPDFDAVPPRVEDDRPFELGRVVLRGTLTKTPYNVGHDSLTRHVFIAGVTGAGKSNTIFHLLRHADVPFLVLEPAKAEYRALLGDPTLKARSLQVFTLGDETISPFRLNPFEVLPGTSVGTHLDLLRAVFSASFGMWTPLPQVLEQCLHQIYADRGWDIAMNTNRRLDPGSDIADSFPTLSDLANKVYEITEHLGYGSAEVTGNIRAALLTRVNGLRAGGKGRMLDVQRSLPMRMLLEQPTILELEYMGDDDDKAFVMGLLLIRLAEYRREEHRQAEQLQADDRQTNRLKHLLIIEEAHRLLANTAPRASQEVADPRGKAVETFANLLSEIRAYGQGIIVADQVPTKLSPDVVKNTGLKIVHRVVAADDRQVLAGAMAMNERQAVALATLTKDKETSQAVVFGEGDDTPLVVAVPRAKDQRDQTIPSQVEVAAYMAPLRHVHAYQDIFLPAVGCADACLKSAEACAAARQLIADVAVQHTLARLVLSTIEDPNALDRLWGDLETVVRARRSPMVDETALMRCLSSHAAYWLAQRRGTQASWSYSATHELTDKLRHMLLSKVEAVSSAAGETARAQFHQFARVLHTRRYEPFPGCARVCIQQPAVCLYRYAAADVISSGEFADRWKQANDNDSAAGNGMAEGTSWENTWEVCLDAAYELIEFPRDAGALPADENEAMGNAVNRTGLCFAQQMIFRDPQTLPKAAERKLETLRQEVLP